VDVAIVERRTGQEVLGTRSRGMHSRTIEVLDQRGIADRFLAAGQTVQVGSFAMIPLPIEDFPTAHNYGLALVQARFEEILAGWLDELPVTILRGREVAGFEQDDEGIDVELGDASRLRARYLVGCDGGRSLVRKAAGIDFAGWDPSVSSLIAEVKTRETPEFGVHRDERGIHGIGPAEDPERVGVVVREERLVRAGEPGLDDLRRALESAYGSDFGAHDPAWISRFTDMTRQAAAYRSGRVLLAGDAAHIHAPMGGQGLNLGIQDAVNLGWKLAQVVRGQSPEDLLDTYEAERHPIGARVLRYTMAQAPLARSDARIEALRETLTELLSMDEPRRRLAGQVASLDIRYDLGEGHPLLGRRMPDLELATGSGPTRAFELLHEARPVLLDLGGLDPFDTTPWADRVRVVRADHSGTWELPVLGEVTAPSAVLIRPDGHVAWVGEGTDEGLGEALERWVGRRTPGGCRPIRD
jgi:2-polyprenyl-6-methoxyphenol hydroxylase-like FAD-dependent oxidoreductase